MFSKKNNSYYYLITSDDLIVKCGQCKKLIEIEETFFIHKSYSKKQFVKTLYCLHCIKDHRKRIYDEFISAEVTTTAPQLAKWISDFPPLLSNSNQLSTFEVADSANDSKLKSDTSGGYDVIDNTKYSGKGHYIENFEKKQIEKTVAKIKELDKPIESDEEIGNILDNLNGDDVEAVPINSRRLFKQD